MQNFKTIGKTFKMVTMVMVLCLTLTSTANLETCRAYARYETPSVKVIEEIKPEVVNIGKVMLIEEKQEVSRISKEEVADLSKDMSAKISKVTEILNEITTSYTEENQSKVELAVTILQDVQYNLEKYPEDFFVVRKQYDISVNRLEGYTNMINSLTEKLEKIEISETADMSISFDFTEEEIVYLLKNIQSNGTKLVQDEELIKDLANCVVSTVTETPINELLAISVMSLESGYFTSNYVNNHNNFGGMQYKGKAMSFDSRTDGIVAAIKCIHNNLKNNNTIIDINESYCPPEVSIETETVEGEDATAESIENEEIEVEPYIWSKTVLSIMESYAAVLKI